MKKNIDAILRRGGEIRAGVYLLTAAAITQDQHLWGENDHSKNVDFSAAPFWVVTDSGDDPIGVDSDATLSALLD